MAVISRDLHLQNREMCVWLRHELSINQSVIGSICVERVSLTWFFVTIDIQLILGFVFGGDGVGQ